MVISEKRFMTSIRETLHTLVCVPSYGTHPRSLCQRK